MYGTDVLEILLLGAFACIRTFRSAIKDIEREVML